MDKRKGLSAEPNVRIEDILAARDGMRFSKYSKRNLPSVFIIDLCHMERTCGTKEMATTRSKLHKILIPKVRFSFEESILFQKWYEKYV